MGISQFMPTEIGCSSKSLIFSYLCQMSKEKDIRIFAFFLYLIDFYRNKLNVFKINGHLKAMGNGNWGSKDSICVNWILQ